MVPGTEQTCKGHIASMRKTDAACPLFSRSTGMQRTRGNPWAFSENAFFFQISHTRRELETSLWASNFAFGCVSGNCQLNRIWNFLGARHTGTPVERTVLIVVVEVGRAIPRAEGTRLYKMAK